MVNCPLGSAAWHRQECSMYLNQLCKGTTAFGFNLLNEVLKETEKRQGRTHNEDGIVTLDLDILQYDDEKFHLRDWTRNYVKDLINEL
jgi:2-amino-4-hydroxy-6-hydroxymethyldihydropteridine diphosphokinase